MIDSRNRANSWQACYSYKKHLVTEFSMNKSYWPTTVSPRNVASATVYRADAEVSVPGSQTLDSGARDAAGPGHGYLPVAGTQSPSIVQNAVTAGLRRRIVAIALTLRPGHCDDWRKPVSQDIETDARTRYGVFWSERQIIEYSPILLGRQVA